jgi:hypothetical protein
VNVIASSPLGSMIHPPTRPVGVRVLHLALEFRNGWWG